MYKEILDSVEGLDTWSIISMILFFCAFLGVIYYTLKMDKKDEKYMSSLPLNDNH